MSLLCTKQFTLSVTGGSTADAYYQCESVATVAGKVPIVDIVGARDLIGGTPGTVFQIAGAVNNGIKVYGAGSSPYGTNSWASNPDSIFALNGSSFTLRFWHRLFASPGPDNYIIGTGLRQFHFETWSGPDSMYLEIVFETGGPSFWTTMLIPDTNWHRYVVMLENGVGYSYKVDNGATVFGARTDPIEIVGFDPSLQVAGSTRNCIDEIGFWRRKLSEAELLADWNGGAGSTYPNVP